jgi:hypothetical protein
MKVVTVSLMVFFLVLIFALFVGFLNFGGIGYNTAKHQSRVIIIDKSRSDNIPSGLRIKFESSE